MDTILPVDFPVASTPVSRLMDKLEAVIYNEENDEITAVQVIGVLRLIEAGLVEMCRE